MGHGRLVVRHPHQREPRPDRRAVPVSYTHLDVYKRQMALGASVQPFTSTTPSVSATVTARTGFAASCARNCLLYTSFLHGPVRGAADNPFHLGGGGNNLCPCLFVQTHVGFQRQDAVQGVVQAFVGDDAVFVTEMCIRDRLPTL